jgi:hypothetical protein
VQRHSWGRARGRHETKGWYRVCRLTNQEMDETSPTAARPQSVCMRLQNTYDIDIRVRRKAAALACRARRSVRS